MSLKRRQLGRTGLSVSEIALGTVELGVDYGIPTTASSRPTMVEADRLLHRALDLGVNLIDTARGYGESEHIIGTCLQHRRSEYILVSKVSAYEQEKLPSAALRARVMRSVRDSLLALRCSHIDIMMVHSASREVIARGELLTILQELKAQGWISCTGASVYDESAALMAMQAGYECLQIPFSMMDRRPERAVLGAARKHNVGIIARSVLLKGALTNRCRYLPESLSMLRHEVEGMMQRIGSHIEELPAIAYRYVLGESGVHSALVGACSLQEVEEAVTYAQLGVLPDSVLHSIRSICVGDDRLLNPATWPALC